MIGRGAQLDELAARLAVHRLVTVMGPGGIGKTRVALSVADRVAPRYRAGVRVIDLTRVDAPEAVGPTLADQLGFPSFAALLASPTDEPALLVVDNCEHVLDAAAVSVADLLDACAAAHVLATSRSPLDVPGESVVMLGPLDLGPAGDTSAAIASDAAQLFLARAIDAGVQLDDSDLPTVADLCRALDGVPLALEIAAARTRAMSPAEILAHLDDLDLLSRPRFRGSARHRSVRAAIEWSHRQLAEDEQQGFACLGVFSGPFTAEDAHAVAAPTGASVTTTIDLLDALVSASLVGAEAHDAHTRYRLLSTIRTFAAEQLAASGEREAVWQRFVDHVAAWPVQLLAGASLRWDDAVLRDLLARFDSCTRVLRWCIDDDAEPERAMAILAALWGVVHQAHAEDVAELAEAALRRWPDPTIPGWSDAAATTATCRYLLGRPTEAIALATDALPTADLSAFAPCTLRRVIAQSRAATGDQTGALAALDDAVLHAEGLPTLGWEMQVFHAELAANLGEIDAGLACVRQVRAESSAAGSELNAVWAATVEATLLLRRDVEAGATAALQTLEWSRRLPYPACERVNVHTLAEAALRADDLPTAARRLAELFELLAARGALTEMGTAVRTTAVVLHRLGRPEWEDLAATAPTLPSVSAFSVPGYERVELPEGDGTPLDPAACLATARSALRAVTRTSTSQATSVPEAAGAGAGPAGFLQRGDVWELEYLGATAVAKHSKGMTDLARLLDQPGRELHCTDLVGAALEQAGTGEVIDATARRRYEERIRELQRDLDEADESNDLVASERAQLELDALVDQLSAAMARSGRSRTGTSSSAERARSTVTQRIRSAIRHIEAVHPQLGAHLRTTIRTGTYCSYRPETTVDWTVRITS